MPSLLVSLALASRKRRLLNLAQLLHRRRALLLKVVLLSSLLLLSSDKKENRITSCRQDTRNDGWFLVSKGIGRIHRHTLCRYTLWNFAGISLNFSILSQNASPLLAEKDMIEEPISQRNGLLSLFTS